MSEKSREETEKEKQKSYYNNDALLAKEARLTTTLQALEAMLKKVQDLRTKVNFERTQLITLIEMSRGESSATIPVPVPPVVATTKESTSKPNVDSLLILDRLYNGEFVMSEEEDDDTDDEEDGVGFGGHDNFGNIDW